MPTPAPTNNVGGLAPRDAYENVVAADFAPGVGEFAQVGGATGIDAQGRQFINQAPPLPANPWVASADGASAGAAVSVNSPANAGLTSYLVGFVVTSTHPAANVAAVAAVTGTLGSPLHFQFVESATIGGLLPFNPGNAVPASGQNQAITVSVPTAASGGTVSIVAYGYQQ